MPQNSALKKLLLIGFALALAAPAAYAQVREKDCSAGCQAYQKTFPFKEGARIDLGVVGATYKDSRESSRAGALGTVRYFRHDLVRNSGIESLDEAESFHGVVETDIEGRVGVAGGKAMEIKGEITRYLPGKIGFGGEYALELPPTGHRQEVLAGLSLASKNLRTRGTLLGGWVTEPAAPLPGVVGQHLALRAEVRQNWRDRVELDGSLLYAWGASEFPLISEADQRKESDDPSRIETMAKRLRVVHPYIGIRVRTGQNLSLIAEGSYISRAGKKVITAGTAPLETTFHTSSGASAKIGFSYRAR